jgi:diguanylate cyclase (GGDEF)-like protein
MGLTRPAEPVDKASVGPSSDVLSAARELVRPSRDPYAGADLGTARRLAGFVLAVGTLIGLAFMPLAPPTAAIGSLGWVIAGLLVIVAALRSIFLLRTSWGVTFNHLLALNFGWLAGVAGLEYLAGGPETPYHELYLLAVVSAGAVHGGRRALVVLGTAILLACAPPLLSETRVGLEAIAPELLLWSGVGVILTVLVGSLRAQRLALEQQEEEARRLARADGLTLLGNRRAFEEAIETEAARAHRTGTPLSVAIVDVDGLKDINDRLGHLEGDAVLRKVADALRDLVRTADLCFRWAGDEFVVLLPNAPETEAQRVCERLGEAVEETCETSEGEPVRVSCGAALVGKRDTRTALGKADEALLAAKVARHAEGPRRLGAT